MQDSPLTVLHLRREALLHAVFVCLDHLFDHLTADGTGLTAGKLAVVAVLEVHTDLSGGPAYILKAFEQFFSSSQICGYFRHFLIHTALLTHQSV